jgi:ubiquinone/menaquinone biosynthesis C-methylase UbiE
MSTDEIRFDDGAAYERFMGKWSQLAGDIFLDWLAPANGLEWLDVGCGNGAFTQMLIDRCAPIRMDGIDPSDGQLAYARQRSGASLAQFQKADAMALPFAADTFDAAVMPLVIFFVPEPAKGVAEMTRVVRAGGTVAAYAWDMEGGHFPYETLRSQMRSMGMSVQQPPSADASREQVMRDLWTNSGLEDVETRQIAVQRTFTDFDDYWTAVLGGPSMGNRLAAMKSEEVESLKSALRQRLGADSAGRITCSARANAVKGRVE